MVYFTRCIYTSAMKKIKQIKGDCGVKKCYFI